MRQATESGDVEHTERVTCVRVYGVCACVCMVCVRVCVRAFTSPRVFDDDERGQEFKS